MKRSVSSIVLTAAGSGLVLLNAGCMGTNAISTKAEKLNLSVAENRWVREGTFIGMHVLWVYRVCTVLDLVVFNSIEFWSGENPVNGKPPLVEMPLDEVREKFGYNDVSGAQVQRLSDTEAKLYMQFDNGDRLTFDVVRTGDRYAVSYMDREFYEGQLKNEIL